MKKPAITLGWNFGWCVSPGREAHDKLNIRLRLETGTSIKESSRLKFAPKGLIRGYDRERD